MSHRIFFRTLIRACGSLLIVAGITYFYGNVVTGVNGTTVALTFLLATLGIATTCGLFEAVLASVAAMLCLNYFFLPPVGTFSIADPQNWAALFAFLMTSVIASQLSVRVKRRASEAMRRQQEMERLYELSRGFMLFDRASPVAWQISHRIAHVFDVSGVAIFDRRGDNVYRTDPTNLLVPDTKLRGTALQGTAFHDSSKDLSVLPLSLGGKPVGSLAIYGGSISDTAIYAIGNLAAISMEQAYAEEATSRMEAARQNEAMKAMLLDALAHEFKTPLTSIKAAASSLLDEERPAQQELVTIIEEETERLDSLVNETIRMARIEAGDLQLEKHPQAVNGLIDSALEKLRILLQDREIRIEVASDLPYVLADSELAALTIRQLVTNSLKYSSPESPITIRAAEDERGVRISVKDLGPGIAEKEQPRIFERYYRSADSAGRIPGTGMGLSIARDIVLAHGGEIWVESVPGQGSEFSFTLPAVETMTETKS